MNSSRSRATLGRFLILGFSIMALLLPAQSCNAAKKKEMVETPPPAQPSAPIYTEAMPAGMGNDEITKSRQNSITRAVAVCSPAIVGINVVEMREYRYRDPFDDFFQTDPFFERFFRRNQQSYRQEVKSLGSGFLISPDGYILTNDHVAGNASKVVITMTNGEEYDAKVIGSDKTTDVALLKIQGSNFPYLKLSNSDDVIIGEWTIAFGNPFGLFDVNAKPTVTVGVVSNTGVNFVQEGRVYRNMIQSDAAISSGNSGGPLVNSTGEVIGMNTIIYSPAQNNRGAGSIGIGFAIPINRVKKIVNMLKEGGKIDRDFSTGMSVQPLTEQIARSLKLDKKHGVVISEITRNSPADKAGFEPGDVILDVDGTPVRREEDVLVIVNDGFAGQKLQFTILRDGAKEKKILTLERYRR